MLFLQILIATRAQSGANIMLILIKKTGLKANAHAST